MSQLMDFMRAQELLRKYGINSARSSYVKSASEAVRFSGGKPIVMKVLSQKALHKSKSGLVKLKLYTEKDISSAFSYLSSRARALNLGNYKIIAQEMVESGTEIIIGGNVDQQFGKMILLGLGGVYVEIFKDVALRVCPINRYDSRSMIQQLKSSGIIAPDVRRERMVESILLKVSRMLVENDISELDLNPIILTGNGYTAVDLRIMK